MDLAALAFDWGFNRINQSTMTNNAETMSWTNRIYRVWPQIPVNQNHTSCNTRNRCAIVQQFAPSLHINNDVLPGCHPLKWLSDFPWTPTIIRRDPISFYQMIILIWELFCPPLCVQLFVVYCVRLLSSSPLMSRHLFSLANPDRQSSGFQSPLKTYTLEVYCHGCSYVGLSSYLLFR